MGVKLVYETNEFWNTLYKTLGGLKFNLRIYGKDGDDEIQAQGGNDLVYACDDDDTMQGGEGSDIIFGQDGDDFIYGDSGSNFIYGGGW